MKSSFASSRAVRSFVIRFALIFGASQAFLAWGNVRPLQEGMATLIGSWVHAPVAGTLISVDPAGVFEITPFCTGITSIALLLGLIFGFGIPDFRTKLAFSGVGILGLFVANLFRVGGVVWAGQFTQNGGVADLLHTLSWFLMSALVLGIWFEGMKRLTQSKNGRALAQKLIHSPHRESRTV